MTNIPALLDPNTLDFPNPERALRDPDGLLAVGGDLSAERILHAYRHGIFPWYEPSQPILWWSPDPRAVLYPHKINISRSLGKIIKQQRCKITENQNFSAVIRACAQPRSGSPGTWLSEEMIRAYEDLHQLGHAHSVEVWQDNALIGGLYGIDLGHIYCGESMFSQVSNASKLALVHLAQRCLARDYELIDCQILNPHLESMGAECIARRKFLRLLMKN